MDVTFVWDPSKARFESSAPGGQQEWSGKTMKNTSEAKAKQLRSDDLKPEYRLDYSKSKPNRFAGETRQLSLTVHVDPDVAKDFQNAESDNRVLRALLTTMPVERTRKTR